MILLHFIVLLTSVSKLRGQDTENCIGQYACIVNGNNLVFFQSNVATDLECRVLCATRDDCNHFSWYDDRGAFPRHCYLFSSCLHQETMFCRHCASGPKACEPERSQRLRAGVGNDNCSPIGSDFGGTWYCFPEVYIGKPVPDGTNCIFNCPGRGLATHHTCFGGRWNVQPGVKQCTCEPVPAPAEGELVCFPPRDERSEEPVTSGTYCLHTCHGHPKREMDCDMGQWTGEVGSREFSCEEGFSDISDSTEFDSETMTLFLRRLANGGSGEQNLIRGGKSQEQKMITFFERLTQKEKLEGLEDMYSNLMSSENAGSPDDAGFAFIEDFARTLDSPDDLTVESSIVDNVILSEMAELVEKLSTKSEGLLSSIEEKGTLLEMARLIEQTPSLNVNERPGTVIMDQLEMLVRLENNMSVEEKIDMLMGVSKAVSLMSDEMISEVKKVQMVAEVVTMMVMESKSLMDDAKIIGSGVLAIDQITSAKDIVNVDTKTEIKTMKLAEVASLIQTLTPPRGPETTKNKITLIVDMKNSINEFVQGEDDLGEKDKMKLLLKMAVIIRHLTAPTKEFRTVSEKTKILGEMASIIDDIVSEVNKNISIKERSEAVVSMIDVIDDIVESKRKMSTSKKIQLMSKMGKAINVLATDDIDKDAVVNKMAKVVNDLTSLSNPIVDKVELVTEMVSVIDEMTEVPDKPGEDDKLLFQMAQLLQLMKDSTSRNRHLLPEIRSLMSQITTSLESSVSASSGRSRNGRITSLSGRKERERIFLEMSTSLERAFVIAQNKNQMLVQMATVINNITKEADEMSITPEEKTDLIDNVIDVIDKMTEVTTKSRNAKKKSLKKVERLLDRMITGSTEVPKSSLERSKILVEMVKIIDEIIDPPSTNPLSIPSRPFFASPLASRRFDGSSSSVNRIGPIFIPTKQSFSTGPRCFRIPKPRHGNITCDSEILSTGVGCTVECNYGYVNTGPQVITCQRDGTWTSDDARCAESSIMVIGGHNDVEGNLAHVEIISGGQKACNVRVAPLPAPRRGLIARWFNGEVLACGGVNETAAHNRCWRYDHQRNVWLDVAPTARERHFSASVVSGRGLYNLGGRDGTDRPVALRTVDVLRQDGGGWLPAGFEMTAARAYHCGASLSSRAFVVTGGFTGSDVLDTVEMFDSSAAVGRWERLPRMRQRRYLHACETIQLQQSRGLLVAGGFDKDYLGSAEVFDPLARRWTPVSSMAVGRQGGQMVLLNGRPTVLGGFYDFDRYPDTVEQYDIASNSWVTLNVRLRKPRRYFAAVNIPASLFPTC